MKKGISFALVLVMVFALAASAVAAEYSSPTPESYFSIKVDTEGDGSGVSNKNKIKTTDEGEDAIVTLTAKEGKGKFDKWVIEGTYDSVEGSEKTAVFKIRPHSDIRATAKFSGSGDSSSGNTSNTSPKTGDPLVVVIGLFALALGTAVLAVKKIKE